MAEGQGRRGRLIRNPCDSADPPRAGSGHRATMRTWTAPQVGQFLEATADDRWSAAWWLLAMTGMRSGEVLGLAWDAVDLDASVVSVRRTLVTVQARRDGEPGMAWSEPKTDQD